MRDSMNLAGQRFGRLVVVGVSEKKPREHIKWRCVCDCGAEKSGIDHYALIKGATQSCGCLQKERTTAAKKKHGWGGTSEYQTWKAIKRRCSLPSQINWPIYGGRGIKVCDEWASSFEAFLDDMGPKPTPKHSIDRIDVNGDYEPGNCRWATRIEQGSNTRKNHFVEAFGLRLTVNEWERRTGIDNRLIHKRLGRGWPPEKAVGTPTPKSLKRTAEESLTPPAKS